MKFNYKILILWIVFLSFDCLISATVAELWIRAFIPVKNICYYHDPTLGDMFCPEQETYGYVEKGYANIFRNNSVGFHDIERSKEKNKNTLRIHFYGDSLTVAAGVPIDKTIPSLVESNIHRKYPEASIEIQNFASAEDSTPAEFLTYQLIGKYFSPDIVICYFMNDFRDNIFETHQRTRSPYYIIDSSNKLVFVPPVPVDTTTFWERFKRSSRLYRLLANKLLESKIYNNSMKLLHDIGYYFKHDDDTQNTTENDYEKNTKNILKEKAWPTTLRVLKEFKEEVEKNGSIFVLVDGMPFSEQYGKGYTNKDFEKLCKNNSINYIPMYKEYSEMINGPDKEKYFLLDSHPKVLGNEKLSEFLTEKLIKKFPTLIETD